MFPTVLHDLIFNYKVLFEEFEEGRREFVRKIAHFILIDKKISRLVGRYRPFSANHIFLRYFLYEFKLNILKSLGMVFDGNLEGRSLKNRERAYDCEINVSIQGLNSEPIFLYILNIIESENYMKLVRLKQEILKSL